MVGRHGQSGGTVSARRPRLLGDVEVQLLPALSASFGDTGKVGASHRVSQREPHLHGGVQGSASSDDYLERHYTEAADWCNHETRTSSVQQWIEHRPWAQLVPGPTKNLIQRVQVEALSVAVCGVGHSTCPLWWKLWAPFPRFLGEALLDLGLAGRARSRA